MAAGDLLTQDLQLEWRGVLLGSGTNLTTMELEGLEDLPSVRGSGSSIAGRHGQTPTPTLLDARYITWSYKIFQPVAGSVTAIRALQAITTLPEPGLPEPEEPLALHVLGRKVLVYAQVQRRLVPTTRHTAVGVVKGMVQWKCADPRIYLLPQRSEDTGLPVAASGGLVFPLEFPLDFGAGLTGGTITLDNSGSAEAWPLFRVTGPAPGPVITDLDRGYRLSFDPTWTLPAGQTVEIDTRPARRTVIFTPSGVSVADRLHGRQWFSIPANSTSLRVGFSAGAYDAAARLEALWHPTAH